MRRHRLLWQLFFAYLWITLAVTLIVVVYAAERVQALYRDNTSSRLESAARACVAELGPLLGREPESATQDQARELASALGVRVTVILPSGKVAAESDEDAHLLDNHRERPEIVKALDGEMGQSTRYSKTLRENLTYVALPARRGTEVLAAVRTATPVRTLSQTLHAAYRELIAAGLLAVALVAGVSFLVSRQLIRPLDDIRRGAERFAGGELDHRLLAGGSEEINVLAESLNRMARQLDERIRTVLRQEREHQVVLSSMEEGVLAVDRGGAILNVNEAGAALLGAEPSALRGRSIYEAVRKPDLLKFIETGLASPGSIDGDLRFYGPEERWLNAHGTILHDPEGTKIGVLVVIHDVTRLRLLENVRRDFVANVSHELRTPITSIKGFVETLLDEGFEDRATALHFLAIVLKQVNRLDAIICDLLLLSRIERGNEEQTIETGPEPLADVLRAAAEMCQQKASDKNVTVAVQCAENVTARINGPLLEQAVINLIDNAIKYSEAGATVYVEGEANGAGVAIRVRDTGCGIASHHVPRLFERFYRVDKARSRELGGTGLGLAIVKHIVTAHHGSVQVESTLGKGSTFSIVLPYSAPAPREEECITRSVMST
jgi:two-component system, OmpR family, phosphate regulon sensor histidine kinase PhoR